MRISAGAGGVLGDDANRLYEEHRPLAQRCLRELETEVALLADLTAEDREDLLQETEVAFWVACRRYGRHGAKGLGGQSFPAFARVHMRASLKAYITRWWQDTAFSLLPDLADLPYESVFALWPEV